MNLEDQIKINNQEDYLNFFNKYITLLDRQLKIAEENIENEVEIYSIIEMMPALISLVNTVGYLRGQDGMFLNIRPRTDKQDELYKYEDLFEKRLKKLIDTIMQSKGKDYYLKRLQQYFVDYRTNIN